MSRKSTTLAILVLLFLFSATTTNAAKRLLPRVAQAANATNTNSTKTSSSAKNINVGVKFRADRKAIILEFSSLKAAKEVTYMFTYDTNGITQGAAGQVSTGKDTTDAKELIFGSCSTDNVCRYDTNIVNARLVVTSTLANGTKIIKPFLLKI